MPCSSNRSSSVCRKQSWQRQQQTHTHTHTHPVSSSICLHPCDHPRDSKTSDCSFPRDSCSDVANNHLSYLSKWFSRHHTRNRSSSHRLALAAAKVIITHPSSRFFCLTQRKRTKDCLNHEVVHCFPYDWRCVGLVP
jgi:hypothetical protein